MENNLGKKLIAVISSIKLTLYEAEGLKITRKLDGSPVVFKKHDHRLHQKSEGHYQKKSAPSSLFDPHSAPKDIEYHEAATQACEILQQTITSNSSYKALAIVSEPKMLGYIRRFLSPQLKKVIYKEITMNLTKHNVQTIEDVVFK